MQCKDEIVIATFPAGRVWMRECYLACRQYCQLWSSLAWLRRPADISTVHDCFINLPADLLRLL